MNILVLMMGGVGNRLGKDIPKQFLLVREQPIFTHILVAYSQLDFIDKMVLVSHTDWLGFVSEWSNRLHINKIHSITQGGGTRSQSVYNGLKVCAEMAADDDVILIHDATHPYVDVEGVKKVISETTRIGAATLGSCSYDTVYELNDDGLVAKVLPRAKVIAGASPEAFRFGLIYPVYQRASEADFASMTSAGAIALKYNFQFSYVKTDLLNLKITFPQDLELYHGLFDYFIKHHMQKT